jgi:hypothetical protein
MHDTERHVGGMFASAGDAAAYGKDGAKGGNVEFEWKVEEGESSGDVFDLKTESHEGAGGTEGASAGALVVDPYAQHRSETTFDVDLSLSAEDKGGGVPIVMVEYLLAF